MKYIYRIENDKGLGPYEGIDAYKTWYDRTIHNHGNYVTHPQPFKDPKLSYFIDNIDKSFKYGFNSMSQLNNWFHKIELQKLKKYGFKIVKIKRKDLDVLYIGKTQVAFKRTKK